MGKITFYCNICAGPLSDWELRKRSMLQPGEMADVCFDDDCDCDYEGGAANDEGDGSDEDDDIVDGDRAQNSQEEGEDDPMVEPNSEEDLARHDSYCNYRRGYWGDILAEGDVEVRCFPWPIEQVQANKLTYALSGFPKLACCV
jgi:hypothetical protein